MSTTEIELTTFEGPRPLRVRVEGPRGSVSGERRFPTVLVLHGFKGFMHWGFFPLLSRRIAAPLGLGHIFFIDLDRPEQRKARMARHRFAATERQINRAWSAAADEHYPEALTCLEKAHALMGETRGRLSM